MLASSIARQTLSGDAGMSRSVTPKARARRSTALTIVAATEAIVPVSPTPFTPSGFVGLGVTVAVELERRQLGRATGRGS